LQVFTITSLYIAMT